VVDHRPVVYGNESYGKYTEIVDPARGRTLAHGVPLAALADADWRFDRDLMAAPPPQPSSFATDGGRFVIVEPADPHDPAELRRESDRGAIEWSVPLTAWNGCGRTAMLEIGDTLWAVRWCSAASGATVVGVHRERGTLVTQRALRSLPNVVHSVYRAEVELREIDGHLVVFGAELGGRYIEALDPKTGVTVVSRTFR
ncbi:MAG TPA: hypothetical protein VFG69_18235, partial [Nannocystaceae bacterium]|nr:hypothetical protein [Nannocystaceae bacterium]